MSGEDDGSGEDDAGLEPIPTKDILGGLDDDEGIPVIETDLAWRERQRGDDDNVLKHG